jgi:RNA polymerase sigma-70 factor (sigma-E family)
VSDKGVPENEEQFRAYCDARLPALLRFGFVLTGDREDAQDLVQTALARTFAAWARVVRRDDPEAYIRRAMINTLSNSRRRGRWRESLVAEVPDRGVNESLPSAVDARLVLVGLLRTLPPRQRATVVLRYCEDRSKADVAALLGCSTGTVKSQTAKGLAKLRAAMPSEEVAG